jgi:hypothetical protein
MQVRERCRAIATHQWSVAAPDPNCSHEGFEVVLGVVHPPRVEGVRNGQPLPRYLERVESILDIRTLRSHRADYEVS